MTNIPVPAMVVSGEGSVGIPPKARNALAWWANGHPAVQAIDAQIAALRSQDPVPVTQVNALKVQRDAAVKAAMLEGVTNG
jgi:hypothetical protein